MTGTGSGGRQELTVAVVAIAAGGGLAALANARAWDTVTVARAAPLGPLTVAVHGRTVVPGVTGLAVVALAGVVALLATRGRARALMGFVLIVTGALLAWQAATGFAGVSTGRARSLVADARTGVVLAEGQPLRIVTSPLWPALALLGAALVVAGGALVTVRGSNWRAMSVRYERPEATGHLHRIEEPDDPDAVRAKADLAMWQSLERGEDPTVDSDR